MLFVGHDGVPTGPPAEAFKEGWRKTADRPPLTVVIDEAGEGAAVLDSRLPHLANVEVPANASKREEESSNGLLDGPPRALHAEDVTGVRQG